MKLIFAVAFPRSVHCVVVLYAIYCPDSYYGEVLVAEEYADIKKCAICLASSDIFHVH